MVKLIMQFCQKILYSKGAFLAQAKTLKPNLCFFTMELSQGLSLCLVACQIINIEVAKGAGYMD